MAKYKDWIEGEGLEKIKMWCRDGKTDAEICKIININPSTFCDWKKKYPELDEALKRTKEVVDSEVTDSLYKRAMGYDVWEITENLNKETGEMMVTKRVKKHICPDTTAQIFWLKNRQPKKWREKPEINSDDILNKLDSILGGIDNEIQQKTN